MYPYSLLTRWGFTWNFWWSLWFPCARCSKSCGGGIQARTRGVRTQAAHGGANCAGPAKEHGLFLVTGIRQIWLENLKNYTKAYSHIKNKLVCIYIYMYEIVHLHSAAPQLSTRNHFGCFKKCRIHTWNTNINFFVTPKPVRNREIHEFFTDHWTHPAPFQTPKWAVFWWDLGVLQEEKKCGTQPCPVDCITTASHVKPVCYLGVYLATWYLSHESDNCGEFLIFYSFI